MEAAEVAEEVDEVGEDLSEGGWMGGWACSVLGVTRGSLGGRAPGCARQQPL